MILSLIISEIEIKLWIKNRSLYILSLLTLKYVDWTKWTAPLPSKYCNLPWCNTECRYMWLIFTLTHKKASKSIHQHGLKIHELSYRYVKKPVGHIAHMNNSWFEHIFILVYNIQWVWTQVLVTYCAGSYPTVVWSIFLA